VDLNVKMVNLVVYNVNLRKIINLLDIFIRRIRIRILKNFGFVLKIRKYSVQSFICCVLFYSESKKREDNAFLTMNSLAGTYVKDDDEDLKVDENTTLFPFRLISGLKTRYFYAFRKVFLIYSIN
jgi:hypothetical protein